MPKHPSPASLVRGSLITLRRKCGTSTCSCAKGKLHETPALSYSISGSTKMLTLRAQDMREVRAALMRYQNAAQALERQVRAGIHALGKRIRLKKVEARKKKKVSR